MNKICKFCQTPFKGRRERRYCSRACAYADRVRPRITKTCALPGCDKTFETLTFPCKPEGQIFCSKECRMKFLHLEDHPRVELICKGCHRKFTVSYKLRRRKYCSRECLVATVRNPNRHHDRIPYYGANWYHQREAARKRDDYTCQACGKAPRDLSEIQCHHIVHFDIFGIERYKEANRLSNLITLCRSCHRHVHNSTIPCPNPS